MSQPVVPTQDPEPVSLVNVLATLLRDRRLIVAVAFLVAFVSVGLKFMAPRTYTSTASFVPAADNGGANRMAGIAAQFGLGGGGSSPEQSPDFYVDLVKSRAILSRLAEGRYPADLGDGVHLHTLDEILESKGNSAALRRLKVIESLRKMVGGGAAIRTGVVTISARTKWPELSHALTEQTVVLINEFNEGSRRSRARAERDFASMRLDSARTELREAEGRLMRFVESNRDIRNSPSLIFQQDRLTREVGIRNQVVQTLVQAYETARIDAVRNTPVITMVDESEVAARPDRRGMLTSGIVALFIGTVLGVLLSLGKEWGIRMRQEDPVGFQDVKVLKREAIEDLRDLLRGRWVRPLTRR